jgi:hypothetical protein
MPRFQEKMSPQRQAIVRLRPKVSEKDAQMGLLPAEESWYCGSYPGIRYAGMEGRGYDEKSGGGNCEIEGGEEEGELCVGIAFILRRGGGI